MGVGVLGETVESGPGQSGWPSERKGGEGGLRETERGAKEEMIRKKRHRATLAGEGRVRRMDWEEG